MAPRWTAHEIQRIAHHVFLPPQLPHSADDASEIALVDSSLTALKSLRGSLEADLVPAAIDNAITLLKNLKAINSRPFGMTDETQLRRCLESLPVGATLAVKVSAQNAAVLVTRHQDDLVFEEFELSPLNHAVINTKGRLVRTFPGLAVAVKASLLAESDFLAMVTNTLSTMSFQKAPGMQPQSKKANAKPDETRDTAHPAMISELFIGVLRGLGEPTTVSTIQKHTRDEVLWDSAEAPWRRSPMWLLIRVALQLVVSRSPGGSHELYKKIMLFIMGQILHSAHQGPLPANMLFTLSAKMHRRLQKMSKVTRVLPEIAMSSISNIIEQVSQAIDARWSSCLRKDPRDLQLPSLATLDFAQDTLVALPALDEYIQSTLSRRGVGKPTRLVPSSSLMQMADHVLPTLPDNATEDSRYAIANLQQFELWVARHIDNWLQHNPQGDACGSLYTLMIQYHRMASKVYSNNPEGISVMVLTVFELWVASDKAANHTESLLLDFDPGIPPTVLQNLLLPRLDQMERLSRVEAHLNDRMSRSTKRTNLLFEMQSVESFPSKYFEQSLTHQALLSTIKALATSAREQKLVEFRKLKDEYTRLNTLFDSTDHEYVTTVIDTWCDPPETETSHSGNCKKCSYRTQRDNLSIAVHEWPLPSHLTAAKVVVFELKVPTWYGHWRDARFFLLQDVLKGERTTVQAQTSYQLSSNDPHLTRHYYTWSKDHRIGLLSQTKPNVVTHYRNKNIGTASESSICVENGLQYKYYDRKTDAYPGDFDFEHRTVRACTYRLPCEALQKFVFRPASAPDGPGPNTVIASQDATPANMTLGEYKELSTIPLGRHIQWANIRLQLAMPGVDFKKPETMLVFLQCIYQTGPPCEDMVRESHGIFKDDGLTSCILKDLIKALQRVKENWESAQAVSIFVAIAARTLSLSASGTVRDACLAILKTARDVSMGWVTGLRDKADNATDNADRTEFIRKSAEVALVCIMTYDVDDKYFDAILAEGNNASVLVQSCIVVQECEHCQPSHVELCTALLDLRRKRLLCRLYKVLAKCHAQLDDAISRSWSAYSPGGSGWRSVSQVADHWLTTSSIAAEGVSTSVHYNLLSGELLVNGLPLDKPPEAYRTHALYSTLFGKATVEVMPSATPGFQFSTKRSFEGYSVQLGLSTSDGTSTNDLIVKATNGISTYETIPSRFVEPGYTSHFVHDFVHFYDVATNVVQFRSVNEPWDASSTAIWTLSKVSGQQHWRLTRARSALVGKDSPTSCRVANVLEPLARMSQIHPILGSTGSTLHIDIPGLRLGFLLARGSSALQSKDFRSMVVDEDQNLGTLIGLGSKIVLKPSKSGKRMVLVAEQEI